MAEALKVYIVLFTISLVATLSFLGYPALPEEPEVPEEPEEPEVPEGTIWTIYNEERQAANIGDEYLIESRFIDVSHPDIQDLATEFMDNAETVKGAVKDTETYIKTAIAFCAGKACFRFEDKASDVLKRDSAVCSGKIRPLIAILRAMGVAARGAIGWTFMGTDHTWVEAWIPGEGWINLETTPISPNYSKWGNCGDGEYYNFEPGSDASILDNHCYSKTLMKYVPCREWTQYCFWVP